MASRRRAAILAEIETRGFVTLEALAEAFAVSMQTVRRDVIALQEMGLIERFHGGAGAKGRIGFNRLEHSAKRAINVEEKAKIARRSRAWRQTPSSTLIGTTMVAAALDGRPRLRSSPTCMWRADRSGQHEIMLPGRVPAPMDLLSAARSAPIRPIGYPPSNPTGMSWFRSARSP